jgi:hypothetical protein
VHLAESPDRRRGRRDALSAQHASGPLSLAPEQDRQVSARTILMRLHNLQGDPRGDRGVKRIATPLEHSHPAAQASQCVEETIPNVPCTSGRVVKPVALPSAVIAGVIPIGARSWRQTT